MDGELTQTTEIGGQSFTITKFTGRAALRIQAQLAGYVAAAVEAIKVPDDLDRLEVEALLPAIGALFRTLSEGETERLYGVLLSRVSTVMGDQRMDLWPPGAKSPPFDVVCQGNPLLAHKLVAWSLKVNFSALFEDARAALKAAQARAKEGRLKASITSSPPPSGG